MEGILAIIPARAGSVRLKDKNVLEFGGMPLVERTIIRAKAAELFARIIVSTDDPRVEKIAERHNMILDRQPRYPQDATASVLLTLHALDESGAGFQFVMLLQPTSPFRCSSHMQEARDLFWNSTSDSLVSVGPSDEVNGAIYLCTVARLRDKMSFYDASSLRYRMSELASIDIDTQEDLDRARAWLRKP
jgi:CMP-N,N'-diacetyllegionaminic acid synthase